MSDFINDNHCERFSLAPQNASRNVQVLCRTYFISGFDPRGSAHYRRLFQTELRPLGWRLGGGFSEDLITRWPLSQVGMGNDGQISELCFLHWDDIAKANWPRNPLDLFGQCVGYAWWYLLKGGLIFKVAALCPGVALCGAYPLLFLGFSCGLAIGVGTLVGNNLSTLPISPQVSVIGGLVVTLIIFFQAWQIAKKLGVDWLARSILFTHRVAQHRDGDLRERVEKLADQLLELELQNPASEVILVGHSSGSFVLAMLAAQLHRESNASFLLPRLKLLTLGQNLANVALYPGAKLFRDDLQELATEPRIPWRDITSTQDYLCFAGVNPYASCGLPLPTGDTYPEMELIDLGKARGIKRRRDLLSNQFDLHFDYLRNHCSGVRLPILLVKGISAA